MLLKLQESFYFNVKLQDLAFKSQKKKKKDWVRSRAGKQGSDWMQSAKEVGHILDLLITSRERSDKLG